MTALPYLAAAGALTVLALALWAATRLPRGPQHRDPLDRHAAQADDYRPRHDRDHPGYRGRHEDATGGPVVLGAHPDGGLALIHADRPAEPAAEPAVRLADERTVEIPRDLIGASA